jgi:hypothetical protein
VPANAFGFGAGFGAVVGGYPRNSRVFCVVGRVAGFGSTVGCGMVVGPPGFTGWMEGPPGVGLVAGVPGWIG